MDAPYNNRNTRRHYRGVVRSAERHQKLLEAGNRLSLESGKGILAIIISGWTDIRESHGVEDIRQYRAALHTEAEQLKERREKDHQSVVIRPKAVVGDMKFDFADPEVTDVIVVGHGTINGLITDNGQHYSWNHAAKDTSYLKQGAIEQYTCGHFPKGMSYHVPLGTFAVSKMTNVIAPLGIHIEGNSHDDSMDQVYVAGVPVVDQIVALNARYAGIQPTTALPEARAA